MSTFKTETKNDYLLSTRNQNMRISEHKVATELNQSRQTFAYWKKERPEVYNTIRGYYELREALEAKEPDIEEMRKIVANVAKNIGGLTEALEQTTLADLEKRLAESKTDKSKFKVLAEYRAHLKKHPKWDALRTSFNKYKRD